jgi:hypothetical protein
MSYGFLAVNDGGQILVSSDTRNLHFVEKAYYYSTLSASNVGAGMRQYAYRCSSSVAPVPFFTMPNSSAYHGWGAIRTIDTSYSKIFTSSICTLIDPKVNSTYTFSNVPVSLYEGTAITIIVNTTNITNGVVMFWKIPNSVGNDFENTIGSFTINNNTGSFVIQPTRYFNVRPETTETYNIVIGLGAEADGTVVATSSNFTVIDSPLTNTATGFGLLSYIASANNTDWGVDTIGENGSTNYFTLGRYKAANALATTKPIPIIAANTRVCSFNFPNGPSIMEGQTLQFNIFCQTGYTGLKMYWEVSNYDKNQFVNPYGQVVFSGQYATVYLTALADYDFTNLNVPFSGTILFNIRVRDYAQFTGPIRGSSENIVLFDGGNTGKHRGFGQVDTTYNSTIWGPYQIPEDGIGGQKFTLEGSDISSRVYDMYYNPVVNGQNGSYKTTPTPDLYWTINHITTNASDFVATTGMVLIDKTITPAVRIPYYSYFKIAANPDATTEGLETFTVTVNSLLTPNFSFTSGAIAIADISTGTTYVTGPDYVQPTNTYTFTAGTTGYPVGKKLYYRINHIDTTRTDFSVPEMGELTFNSNTEQFQITTTANSQLPNQDKYFTVSITDVAPSNYMYWSVNHITTSDSDFISSSGSCIGTGFGYWYWGIAAAADSQTEGTETFSMTIREGSPSGSIVATTGAIKISDLSVGYRINLPAVILEKTTNTITVNTLGIANGTTLYWVLNNITTSDVDFEKSYGSIAINNNTGSFVLKPIQDLAIENPQQFTINLQTEPPNVWQLELLKSGTDDVIPEVYVFADPRVSSPSDSETYGLLVYRDDGTISFDSRRAPLAIIGGKTVTYPYSPVAAINLPQGEGTEYWHDACKAEGNTLGYFSPNNENAYNLGTLPAKPIFFATSLAQACQSASSEHTLEEHLRFPLPFGGYIELAAQYRTWRSDYWSFYRGGIRASGNTIFSGWVQIANGCGWYYTGPQNTFLGFIEWGAYPKTGSNPPYSNETINLSANAVLIADGSRYD